MFQEYIKIKNLRINEKPLKVVLNNRGLLHQLNFREFNIESIINYLLNISIKILYYYLRIHEYFLIVISKH